MKTALSIWAFCLLSLSASAYTVQKKVITLPDGEKVMARLCLPDNQPKTIVVCIHGTGPNNYLNKRTEFNYYDEVADGFCSKGVAFFTYNRRGVDIGGTPPHYNKIDTAKYAKYAPVTEAEDIECMISALKSDQQFKDCKIILYGVSEGTMIAPMVAERRKVDVDAIFLHGYANENMRDIIEWQNAGYGVMILVNSIFDKDGDGKISREEYESDEDPIKRSKAYFFKTCH